MTRTRWLLPLSLGLFVACGESAPTVPAVSEDAATDAAAAVTEAAVYDIAATVDVQPNGNPTVNLGMGGYITVAVFDAEDLPIEAIDPSTVTFQGAAPAHDLGSATVAEHHMQMLEIDGVEYSVFLFHFDPAATDLASWLGQWLCADLNGQTYDGVSFGGCDDIRVMKTGGGKG